MAEEGSAELGDQGQSPGLSPLSAATFVISARAPLPEEWQEGPAPGNLSRRLGFAGIPRSRHTAVR